MFATPDADHQKRQWYCCLRSLLKKNELNTFIITAVDWIYVALEGATVLPVETFTIKQPSERWNKSKTKRIQEKKKGHLSKKKKRQRKYPVSSKQFSEEGK